jgi:ABC-type sugar transport system substrate-binding protein/DNA-binding response OmpR family regulator/nitrogen-specific signal transduction histidine kinase
MKHIKTILIPVLFFLLFACQKPEKKYFIGISQCSDDEWRQKMNTEMQHEAMFQEGVSLTIKTVTDNTEKQIADIQSFIDSKVDLIIVTPNQTAPVTPVIEKAYFAGIPVILVDRKISSENYTAYIGANNLQIGEEVGNYVVKLLNGKGNIVEIRGLEDSSPDEERHNGFISVIDRYPAIKLLSSKHGAWLKDVAEKKMDEILECHEDIDLVYALNDRMAAGAYNAAARHGKADKIAFIGIDALPGNGNGIEQVLEGKLKASFIYPTSGDEIIQLAVNILQQKPYKKNNTLYTNVVDEANARVLKLQTDAIIEQEKKIDLLDKQIDYYLSRHAAQRNMLFSVIAIVIVFIGLFILIYKAYRTKNRLNLELKKRNDEINQQKELLEQQRDQLILLSKQLEEATHAKLVFFTNISHEFRTPLTLISCPVSSLLSEKSLPVEHRRLLTLVQKNVGILLKLIDQIIDFRKYENGKLKLQLNESNLYRQMEEWNESFKELTKEKHLHFEFNAVSDEFSMVYDLAKMERIYFNLLSNAYKFTPEKGFISVNMDKISRANGNFAVIRISNSGKGIAKQDILNIFERFYQVDSQAAGSGIGLALVKSLVELHRGDIQIESDDCSGMTTFTVTIPFTQNAATLQENTFVPHAIEHRFGEMKDTHKIDHTLDYETDTKKESVLVIDDNPDIRSYIKTVLQNNYTVIEAEDGAEGFQNAVKYVPDIIVCDVMMPPPDGLELCRQLKREIATSHIPVILLTACSLDEQRITGFESGADDYVSKPFNSFLLEARIHNLIENRKHLKELFRQNLFLSDNKEILKDVDKQFMEKLKTLIEKDLSDANLNVEDLAAETGLSRTQLYRKVKQLSGYSPNELLKVIRLKRAFVLLSSSELNISEIAYDTGFTSPSYFAKCFKEYYNESPTGYLKRIR